MSNNLAGLAYEFRSDSNVRELIRVRDRSATGAFSADMTLRGLSASNTNARVLDICNNSNAVTISTASNGVPAERLRVDAAGNVGVGTSNAGALIDIAAPALATYGTSEVLRLRGYWAGAGASNPGTGPYIRFTNWINSATASNPAPYQYNLGSIGGVDGTGNWGGGLAFSTAPAVSGGGNLLERMRIDYLGNVGIGSTSPLATLHVANATAASLILERSTGFYASQNQSIQFKTNYETTGFIRQSTSNLSMGTAGSPSSIYFYTGNTAGYANGTGDIFTGAYTATNDKPSMCINAGNVGIGTTAPNAMLQMSSTTSNRLQCLYVYSPQAGIVLESTSASRAWNIWCSIPNDSIGSGALAMFDVTAGLYRMVINTGGQLRLPAYGAGTLSTDSTGLISASSDKRIKQNIQYIQDTSLDKILALKPATFELLSDKGRTRVGFIAQDVETVIPDAVDGKKFDYWYKRKDDGSPLLDENGQVQYDENPEIRPRSLDNTAIIAHCVKAIQEQQVVINTQKQQLQDQAAEIASMKAFLAAKFPGEYTA